MTKPIIVNAEPDGYCEEAKDILRSFSTVIDGSPELSDLKAQLSQADALIVRLGNKIDDRLLASAKNLKVVASATTGLNHIDLDYLSRRRIGVISLKGEAQFLSTVTATAEHTWGLLLSLIRKANTAHSEVISGTWDRNNFIGRELSDLTIGIVGYGRLGKIVTEYAKAFRMNVLIHDPFIDSVDCPGHTVAIEELLEHSDVVSLHVSLSDSTEGLFGAEYFNLMRRGAFFVNTSRGELVDEKALLDALRSGRVAGAAVDVLANESDWGVEIPRTHPLVDYARRNTNLLITPHIAGATSDSMRKTEIFIANKIQEYFCTKHL